MKKICFVLTVSTGINYGSMFAGAAVRNYEDFKEYFSKYYDVSVDYIRDKDSVDILVVPEPFTPFDNERNLPIIKVPAVLFMQKDFKEIKKYIDEFYSEDA